MAIGEFDEASKKVLYQVIHSRRDMRSYFTGGSIREEVLCRLLDAAHHAPSVGFMQPWNFIVIKDIHTRTQVHQAFQKANAEAVLMFSEEKQEKYKKLKLEGILESALNICVTCDRNRAGPVVLGRTTDINMDFFSTACAIQNLWLAARVEGIGVGWVSILHREDLKKILKLPENIVPLAYLCLGYVSKFPEKPDLETSQWLPRLPLENLVYCEAWGQECQTHWPKLHDELRLGQNN